MLGLTWQNIRAKLVRATSETVVAALETGFDIVVTLVREGPAAAWEKIKEQLSNLKDMLMEQILSFVKGTIVEVAITKILSFLSPVGAFIQAIIGIYNTIMFFIERLQQIAMVVASFIDSIAAIAAGNIGAAAARVEPTMAGLLTVVISFLARFAGLGRVSDEVKKIIDRIRAPIDRALDKVVEWIVTTARRLFASLFGRPAATTDTRTPAQKQQDLQRAVAEATALLSSDTVSSPQVRERLPAIQQRYRLTRLALVLDSENDQEEVEHLEAEVNPTTTSPKQKKLKKHRSPLVRSSGGKYFLKTDYSSKEYIRDSLYGKSYRSAVYDWMDGLLARPRSAGGLRHPTDSTLYYWNGQYWKRSGNTRPSVDHTFPVVAHWNQNGRRTTQDVRKDWFNKISGMAVVPFSENSSAGAKLTSSYLTEVFIDFRGQE